MQLITPTLNNAISPAMFTYEKVLDVSADNVKGFSDFLLKQNAISVEEHKSLAQCDTFEPPFDVTAAKIIKILDVFLLLNSLDDPCILFLKEAVKENSETIFFERMITDLQTGAEIDQKIESATRNLIDQVKPLLPYGKNVDAFDLIADSLLVTGQFDKANLMLKGLAKKLNLEKEPSTIDQLLPYRHTFVLVNAPCWSPKVRATAIKIAFESVITTLKVDNISSHIKMLTTRVYWKGANYKKDIGEYLKIEAKKCYNHGYKKKAELLKTAFKYPNDPYRAHLESEALEESMGLTNHSLKDSKKNQRVEKPATNRNHLLKNNSMSDFLWTINNLPYAEDRFFALSIMAHYLLPGEDVHETLKCGASLTDLLERLNFIHDLFGDRQLNEKDKLVLNDLNLLKMMETAKWITESLAKNTPLVEVLDAISSIRNEDFRCFVLYKMANQFFPHKNVLKWLDKCNKLETDVDRLAELVDFFESMLKDGDNYLKRLQLAESEKCSNIGTSKMLDMINMLPENKRRLELFEQILPNEDHDTLLVINATYDDPIERRQSLREYFNK